MNIDERIEALTMNLELLSLQGQKTEEKIDKLTARIDSLTSVLNGTLQIVASHENRIHKLEQPGGNH